MRKKVENEEKRKPITYQTITRPTAIKTILPWRKNQPLINPLYLIMVLPKIMNFRYVHIVGQEKLVTL